MKVDAVFENKFLILLGFIPAGLVLLGALIMGLGYKITDKDAQMYADENAKIAKFRVKENPQEEAKLKEA